MVQRTHNGARDRAGERFGRLLTAMVTPLDADDEIDYDQAQRLARALLASGSQGVVVGGTTGEAPTLNDEEKLSLFRAVKEAVGEDGAVIAGTGTYNTRESIDLSRQAEDAGVDGLLLTVPYYNKPPQEGLFRHFEEIAAATHLPCILYNIPGRTSVNLAPETIIRLASIPNIVGVKEASGNMSQMCEVCRAVPPDFIVLSGDDALALPLMSVGGRGVISVISNEIPSELAQMVEAAERDDFKAARAIHHRLMPLMSINFVEANPVPVKAAMTAMGLIEEVYRLPLVSPKPESKEKILKVLKDLGLLKGALV